MVLYEVVQAIQVEDGELVGDTFTGYINTGREFKSQRAFNSYADKHGEEFVGKAWMLMSEHRKSDRMKL